MGKKSKKAKADKLPKTIAGVKVPRELRDIGGVVAKLARDANAREVALAALTAALAARKDNRQAARKAVGEAGDAAESAGKAAGWIGPALTAAVVEAGRMLLDAYDNGGKAKEQPQDEGATPKLADNSDGKQAKKNEGKADAAPGVTH